MQYTSGIRSLEYCDFLCAEGSLLSRVSEADPTRVGLVAECENRYATALAKRKELLGPLHPLVAEPLERLANLAFTLGSSQAVKAVKTRFGDGELRAMLPYGDGKLTVVAMPALAEGQLGINS